MTFTLIGVHHCDGCFRMEQAEVKLIVGQTRPPVPQGWATLKLDMEFISPKLLCSGCVEKVTSSFPFK